MTFNITPSTATISITASDPYAEITETSVTADEGSTVAYQVTAEGYSTFAGNAQLTTSTVANINLLQEGYRAAWTNNDVTVFTNTIDPRSGDDVFTLASDSTASGSVASTTTDVSTGLITNIYVGDTSYTRNASEDASRY